MADKIRRAMPIIYFVIMPLLIACGVVFFGNRSYNVIAILVAILACLPVFIRFERGSVTLRELVAIAVMTAIAVLGRLIFAPLPGFKPIAAIIIIAAISFGSEAGFIIGALSVLISNIYFMQGPWTPFQMLAFGVLGFFAGVGFISRAMNKWPMLVIAGVIGGVLYSLVMDVWTVLAVSGEFSIKGYFYVVATSLPSMGIYALANVIFLLILSRPLKAKLGRLKVKYGMFL